jgi:positive control factor
MHISEQQKGENRVEIYTKEDTTYRELDFEELIEQYKKSLAPILAKRKEIKLEINRLEEFILNKKRKCKAKEDALVRQQLLKAEDRTYSEIQGDLEYAIYWMKNGHKPGPNRGIDRKSVYQNTKLVDPIIMQRFYRSSQSAFSWDVEKKENVITPSERIILDKAMAALTEKELEVFLMYKGKGLSQYEIGRLLNISRNSVKSMLARANKKVSKIIQEEKDGDNE